MLSNKDIFRELGKNICIFPISSTNIKAASVNLTASKMGWSLKTKKSIKTVDETKLIIPAHDTALIETEEIIWVSDKISGTYHTRVQDASIGIGHISTTLDPGWIGRSLIALHNVSDSNITIVVGDPFVTLTFYYVDTKAKDEVGNPSARVDILHDYELTAIEKRELNENPIGKDRNALLQSMKSSEQYQKIQTDNKEVSDKTKRIFTKFVVFLLLCAGLLLIKVESPFYRVLPILLGAFVAFFLTEFKK